jgi:hypothetical protein
MTFTAFTHPDDVDVSTGLYRELVEDARASYQYEKRYVRKDGEVIWCRVSVWSDAGADDSAQVAIAMIEDITQAKLAELAVQDKTTRLERIIATQRDIAAASSGDLDQVMQVIVERAQALTHYLSQLPVNEIKIDRSFVMNMAECDNDAVIVRSTIDLGRNLGLQVVTEGVETEAAWDQLSQPGCTLAQGYYLSWPVPAAELTHWLRRRPLEAGRGTRANIRRVA